jgi:hypothetical protein
MMLNSCSEIDQIITCEKVNQLIGVDHRQRMLEVEPGWGDNLGATHKGLDTMELVKVFRHYGFRTYRQSYKHEQRNFREFLYGFVESGYPALLNFTVSREHGGVGLHALPVFGHTLNSDSWFPLAFAGYVRRETMPNERVYLSTIDWVDDFIVNDDNFGMQFCIPAHSFKPEGRPDPGLQFTPVESVGLFPERSGVTRLSYGAEKIAWSRVHSFCKHLFDHQLMPPNYYYLWHIMPYIINLNKVKVVLRPVLVSRDRYLQHLRSADNLGKSYSESEYLSMQMELSRSEFYWLIEITEPDLYVANKSKVIDVLIDVSVSDKSVEENRRTGGVIMMRFPGFAVAADGNEYRTLFKNSAVLGHMPMVGANSVRPLFTTW